VSFGGKQKELVANNLTVLLHDHVILKILNAWFNALLDHPPRCAKNSKTKLISKTKEGSDYDTTSNFIILGNL